MNYNHDLSVKHESAQAIPGYLNKRNGPSSPPDAPEGLKEIPRELNFLEHALKEHDVVLRELCSRLECCSGPVPEQLTTARETSSINTEFGARVRGACNEVYGLTARVQDMIKSLGL